MLGKLFNRKSVPENDGDSSTVGMGKLQLVKVFELELSNMEDTPVYALTHQLSIGSEIGNIVINDPSVSPRHATFILQQDVVSVVDHGSVAGTFVNETRLHPGKFVILEETDTVKIGDLEVKLRVSNKEVVKDEVPEVPVVEEEAPPADLPLEETIEKSKKKKTSKKAPLKKVEVELAANSVVRLFAVIGDLLLAYALLVILSPFDEFRSFLEFIPGTLTSLLDVDWNAMTETILQDAGFVGDMLKDAFAFISSTFHFGPLLITFILSRLVTTLLFGVSAVEFLMGIRASGNGIWARIGGVLRVLIGIITGPFIIFDAPAIISRRTLKEFMSFTKITAPSKLASMFGIVIGIPALIALALISPLVQGFEPPQPIVINEKIDQRVKAKDAATEGFIKDHSEIFRFDISYDPKELLLIPNYKFYGVKSKLNLKSSLVFYQRNLQRPVELEIYKTFNFKQLLGIGIKGNVPLYEKYPEIYSFVYEALESNPVFKVKKNEKTETAFANEFIQFTKASFAIDPQNALDVMQSESFLIKGMVDYKSSFLSLIEYKDFDQIGFIKLGNTVFMKISFMKQKPFDLIIPLLRGEGKIYKVTFDKREELGTLASQFYKFNFGESNWQSLDKPQAGEVMTPLQSLDFFSSGKFREQQLTGENAQALYAYYFETSGNVLTRNDVVELDLWKNLVRNLPKLIETIPSQPNSEGFDPKIKLLQNFRDLIDALENNNIEYFGISQTTTL